MHNSTSVSKGCSFLRFGRSVFVARDAKEENSSYIQTATALDCTPLRRATTADVSRKCAAQRVGEASKHFFGKLAAVELWERFSRWRKTDQIITGYAESVSTQQRSLKPPTDRVVLAV